ncbi:hypothetical protein FOXB_00943 [Fusarium oxysporum f. sp. conglutinans Fo5176]|uniref:Hsp70 protein n=3 Tax=Fusarium oxysporum f. sp. conglutinans TaxID=100902 RepID=F9F3G8_FUSOF|nr:hypothetical protein FOXB_00943 [Fusarium oxysporum f. sp. conglutinans Fo5176]KAG6978682.1 hypothetical protein FocnCong_v011751 [Fusarium oxysporum f. sp. conglutinans]KAI8397293.1 hypothetical protein FOFC_20565 [Fusarium oxysporum]
MAYSQHQDQNQPTRSASIDSSNQDDTYRFLQRIIIAIDFGTEYSNVSYTVIPESHSLSSDKKNRIYSIANYADSLSWGTSVPSKVIYPLEHHSQDLNSPVSEKTDLGDASGNDGPGERFTDVANSGPEDRDPHHGNQDTCMEIDNVDERNWGHRAEEHWRFPATHSDPDKAPLSRIKLLLDDSSETEKVREELINQLDTLEKRGVIQQNLDVIVDYLTCLLLHALSELQKKGIDDSYRKDVVICVPVTWKEKAREDMRACLAKALRKAEFGGVNVQENRIENLHIESELDAAAAHMLATQSIIKRGESFVLLDAGGGIVQAKTYRVDDGRPFPLCQGIVPPRGGFHGSSCLDEDFRKYMERLLAEETYLEQGVEAMNWMVEEAILRFKVSVKPNFHCDQDIKKQFYIPRLRDNEKKGFKEACVHVDRSEIEEMFTKQLDAIFEIIKSQLNDARGLGYKVEKIVLIGGFGRSRFLIDFLKERVAKYSQEGGSPVALLPLEESTRIPDIVSSGAVLLAMNQPPVAKAKGASSFDQRIA